MKKKHQTFSVSCSSSRNRNSSYEPNCQQNCMYERNSFLLIRVITMIGNMEEFTIPRQEVVHRFY